MRKLAALPAFLLSAALAGGAGRAPAPQFLEVWEGTFTCAGTPISTRLSIADWSGESFRVVGETLPSTRSSTAAPGLPRARAELTGTLSGDFSAGTINLTGWRWQVRPAGYDLAKVSARYALSSDYRSIKLTFDDNAYGCTAASFGRVK